MKKLLVIILALILVASLVSAVGLEVDDVQVEVDGDDERKADENGGNIEVKPGSEVEMEFKLQNTFDRDDDIEIENVLIEYTILDIDDGDDIDDESDEIDIKEHDSEKITMIFDIPLRVEDGVYEMIVTITGEDENGTDYEIEIDYDIEVEKERHELVFERLELAPTVAECGDVVQIDFTIVNIGEEDEDDTKIEINAPAFDYYFTEDYDFETDPDDDEIEYSKRATIDTQGISPGIYTVEIKASYGGSNILKETKQITVGECAASQPTQPTQPSQPTTPDEPDDTQSTTVTDSPSTAAPAQDDVVFQSTAAPSPRYIVSDTKSKSESNDLLWIIVIIITDIVLIVAGVLIYLAFRKKK